MPIYEYECGGCGSRFERRQDFWDEPVRACPQCEGKVRRLIHPVGVVFKGNGFYVTDNRPKSVESDKPVESSGDKKTAEVVSTKKD
ncbi:MAG TPA: FmdB family zinc ribbon protein [Dehalococcoidia bacterium]|nr:FmdB family zinc ribbon protein [Dehalococcoidia bacterium]HLE81331.1 FmdB family zinc ribbon protein [Dehalococcoidia bacterium]